MPKVGDEEYAYTPEGIEAAQKKAKEIGGEVVLSPGGSYDAGGRVKKLEGYYGGGMVGEYMGGYKDGGKVEKK